MLGMERGRRFYRLFDAFFGVRERDVQLDGRRCFDATDVLKGNRFLFRTFSWRSSGEQVDYLLLGVYAQLRVDVLDMSSHGVGRQVQSLLLTLLFFKKIIRSSNRFF